MKKIFGLLTFILIGFINFGYCSDIVITDGFEGTYTSTNAFYNDLYGTNTSNIYKFCISNNSSKDIEVWYGTYRLDLFGGYDDPVCFALDDTVESVSVITTYNYSVYSVEFMQISDFNSLNCQIEYNLIPISSVDENYCVSNGLCPANDCPVGTGDGNWSALYINNIQHLSAPIINVDIPEEFDWDYSVNSGEFNLDIIGYNVDTDYIAGIITTQNSKPTNEDLNNIITNVIPLFVPGLVIILFIYFVFRFLKKIF